MADDREPEMRSAEPEQEAGISTKLLELLVCPLTKKTLVLDKKRCELISKAARLAYPVRGGIPIMLPSEARTLDEGEY